MSPGPVSKRLKTRDMLSTEYSLQSVEVTWLRPKAATKLARTDAQMSELRRKLERLTQDLRSASAQSRSAA